MMDVVDVLSVEAEANMALGYIMAAQVRRVSCLLCELIVEKLQVRRRNYTEATAMVDAAIGEYVR